MRWRPSRWKSVSSPGLLVVCVFLSSQRIGYCESPPTISDITRAWKARQEAVETARFEWAQTNFIRAGTMLPHQLPADKQSRKEVTLLPETDVTYERSVAMSFSGNMMRYEYDGPNWVPQMDKSLPRRYVSTFDGNVGKMFHGGDDRGGRDYHSTGFIRKELLHYDYDNPIIRPILLAYRGCRTEMGGINLGQYAVSSKQGRMGKHTCWILLPRRASEFGRSYWVDTQREFLVLRVAATRGERPASTLDISYVADSDHGWIPSEWQYVNTGGTRDKVFKQSTVTVTHYEINQDLPRSAFQLEFEPGTRVSDRRTGDYYIVREHGRRREITDDEVGRGASYEEMMATETGEAGFERTSAQWLWLSAPAVIGLVLLTIIALRRKCS